MSEYKERMQASPKTVTSLANNGEAFRRAEDRLAAGNEDKGERARQALAAIEGPEAANRPPNPTDEAEALTQRINGDPEGDQAEPDPALEAKVDDALAEKAREAGVEDANETTRIVWDLTPHNL